jgi:hypothetical protein
MGLFLSPSAAWCAKRIPYVNRGIKILNDSRLVAIRNEKNDLHCILIPKHVHIIDIRVEENVLKVVYDLDLSWAWYATNFQDDDWPEKEIESCSLERIKSKVS